jgi:tetratricopeptide (TPR) repeat protein
MESISSQVAYNENVHILDDKGFIVKFIFLMLMIVTLASYIVFQGFVTVDKLTLPFSSSGFSAIKLESIEKNLNGNSIDLTLSESDFDGLAELDLSDIEILEKEQVAAADVKKTVAEKAVKKVAPAVSKKKKVLISSQNIASLSFIKKKFYATNNIAFSLLLSEKFLEKKEYKKALKWALISNEIDENSEQSWILFAKSKMKLGKKQDAINALTIYLKNNNSTKVKKILDDIKKIG